MPRIFVGLLLAGVLLFCLFGILATFEPLPAATQWAWRIGYGAVAAVCGYGLFRLVRRRAIPRK